MMLRETTFARLGRAWDKFFFEPGDAFFYSFFRVAFAVLLLVNNAAMYPSLDFFFGEQGGLPFANSQLYIGPGAWTVFAWLPKTAASLWIVYWIFNAASVTLLLGLFSRCSAIVVYFCLVSFHHRNNFITDGEDSMFRTFGLLLIVMPLGKFLSVDRVVAILRGKTSSEERKAAPVALRIIQIYLCLIFFSSCWWKLRGKDWLDGTAMYYVSRLDDFFGRLPMPNLPFENMLLTKLITWSVIAVEGLTPFLIWFKETRRAVLLLAIAFHLGCEYTMNLFLFHWLMILGWLCFLSEAELQRVAAFFARVFRLVGVRPVTLSFDAGSENCRRLVTVLSECDLLSALSFEGGRKTGSIELRTCGGVRLSGLAAVRCALRSVPLAWPFLPLFYFPGVVALGDRWLMRAQEIPAQPE